MAANTFRVRRLRSPVAFLCFLGISSLGLPVAVGCTNQARAEEQPLWKEGNGKPVTNDGTYDPRVSLAPLIKTVAPAVVMVRATGRGHAMAEGDLRGLIPDGAGMPQPRGMGSGFVISKDGLVITNHHVIDGRRSVEVELADDRVFEAKVLGSDPETDIAVLRLNDAKDLPIVVLGSSEKLEVGDWVVAIGSPMGLEHSASTGIVAAKGRGSLGLYPESFVDFIQLDAALAPGNSGGPLFNLSGEVVGINTAVGYVGPGRGPGFAIPIDQAKKVIPQLQKHGKVARGWLGIGGRTVEPAASRPTEPGAIIGVVYAGTPGDRAGLRAGDRIVQVGDHALENFDDLRSKIANLAPGEKLTLTIVREGKKKTVEVTLEERPSVGELVRMREPGQSPGVGGEDLYGDTPPRLGVDVERTKDGLTVRRVQSGSMGERLGLKPGDVLDRINGQRVDDAGDVRKAVERDRNRIEVRVRRKDGTHTAVISRG